MNSISAVESAVVRLARACFFFPSMDGEKYSPVHFISLIFCQLSCFLSTMVIRHGFEGGGGPGMQGRYEADRLAHLPSELLGFFSLCVYFHLFLWKKNCVIVVVIRNTRFLAVNPNSTQTFSTAAINPTSTISSSSMTSSVPGKIHFV